MSARPPRARLQSLCGTARGLASKQTAGMKAPPLKKPCRYAAIWECQRSEECSRRMDLARR